MDRDGFETLVRSHQAEVYRYVRYLGADRPTAEDLAQETFVAALKSPELRADRAPAVQGAWLRGVARNVFLMHCRRAKGNPVKADSVSLEGAEAVWSAEFLREGDGFDYVEALRKCLEDLPEKQRAALQLRYVAGRSRSDMATSLKLSADGVKSMLRRVRGALSECVSRRVGAEKKL